MFAFYSLEEISHKSGLTQDQILRLGMSGTLVFSILEHTPRNYEEVDEFETEDGQKAVRTRTNHSMELIANEEQALKLKYISPEDVINVVTNEAPNRKTLVHALYLTRELDTKQGKWLVNCPWKVGVNDLVVSHDEWKLFAKGIGKKIRHYLPLAKPEQVTVLWLIRNLSIGIWISAISLATSIFLIGAYIGKTDFFN